MDGQDSQDELLPEQTSARWFTSSCFANSPAFYEDSLPRLSKTRRRVNVGWKPVPTSSRLATRPRMIARPLVGSVMRDALGLMEQLDSRARERLSSTNFKQRFAMIIIDHLPAYQSSQPACQIRTSGSLSGTEHLCRQYRSRIPGNCGQ